jgi:hypothetical protein
MLISVLLTVESIPSLWELAREVGTAPALAQSVAEVARAIAAFDAKVAAPLIERDRWGYSVSVDGPVAHETLKEAVRDAMEKAAERELFARERRVLALNPQHDPDSAFLNRLAMRIGLRGVVVRASVNKRVGYAFSPDAPSGQVVDLGNTMGGAILALNRIMNPRWPEGSEAPPDAKRL